MIPQPETPRSRVVAILARLAAAALCLALALAPLAARADFWRWSDDDGVTHYTTDRDRIPRAYRDRAQLVVPSAPTGPLPARGGRFEPVIVSPERSVRPPDAADDEPRELRPGDPRSAELVQLERRLGALREEIKVLISQQRSTGTEFTRDPRLVELSDELPQLQQRIRVLRGELGAEPAGAPGEAGP